VGVALGTVEANQAEGSSGGILYIEADRGQSAAIRKNVFRMKGSKRGVVENVLLLSLDILAQVRKSPSNEGRRGEFQATLGGCRPCAIKTFRLGKGHMIMIALIKKS
jgi:hypothetical protein